MATLASKAHFGVYNPADIGWGGSHDPEAHSNLLKPFSFNGVTFGPMHVDVHGLFAALLAELVPKIEGGLVAGTCGCYNPSSKTVGGDRSFHTYAIAIDVNWNANPMYRKSHPTGPHTLPLATSGIAKAFGCEWGGDWSYPQDWMHIECHLSPAAARTVKAGHKVTIGADSTDSAGEKELSTLKLDAEDQKFIKDVVQNNTQEEIKQLREVIQNNTKLLRDVIQNNTQAIVKAEKGKK